MFLDYLVRITMCIEVDALLQASRDWFSFNLLFNLP